MSRITKPPTAAPPPLAHERLDAARFSELVELNVALDATEPEATRRAALRQVLRRTSELLTKEPDAVLPALPRLIGEAMAPYGWLWNGYYVARGDELHLGHAFGPPVCSPLERHGGPLSSGMCFDALLLNQTLAAYDVKSWPGYVSCDSASGLQTVSGLVCPLRDPAGRPIAVWDLDAAQSIQPADVRFFDVLFASLARTVGISAAMLAPALELT